jgi:hypothetical protein
VEANVSTEGARETELGKKMIKEKIQSDIRAKARRNKRTSQKPAQQKIKPQQKCHSSESSDIQKCY